MKKIWAIFLVFFLNLLVNNFADASSSQIYISRVSANDSNEFVEIHNPGDEFEIKSLKLYTGDNNLLLEIKNQSFLDGGYILIRPMQNTPADFFYEWKPQKFQISNMIRM